MLVLRSLQYGTLRASIITLLLAANIHVESSPTHHCFAMAAMHLLVQRLREKVRWLVVRSDMMDTDLFSLDVIPEVMKFDVEVFGPRSILVHLGHF